jgi:ABC-2 type transport system permease protein
MNHLMMFPLFKLVLLFSKFRLTENANMLLAVIMIAVLQSSLTMGFNFEIGHYLLNCMDKISAFCHLGIFSAIHSNVVKNYLLGFFVLLIFSIGLVFYHKLV